MARASRQVATLSLLTSTWLLVGRFDRQSIRRYRAACACELSAGV